MKRISPTGDLAFKKVLASDENKDILCGLINDFFNVNVTVDEITIKNPYNIKEYRELIKDNNVSILRETIKDVSASFKCFDFISEMQIKKMNFFSERVLFYTFERYSQNYNSIELMKCDGTGKPNKYSGLRPVYALNILGYSHFCDDDALRIFELYDPKRNKHYDKDLLFIGFFELLKPNVETKNQRHWRDYFINGEVDVNAPDYILKASRIIEAVNMDEEEHDMLTLLERAQARHEAEIYDAFYDGRNEGKAEGNTEGKLEAAINIIKELDLPLSKAMSITGLPESEKKQLISELSQLQVIYRQ
jgi:predicted transposase/invertase (TIGR01784 family)